MVKTQFKNPKLGQCISDKFASKINEEIDTIPKTRDLFNKTVIECTTNKDTILEKKAEEEPKESEKDIETEE